MTAQQTLIPPVIWAQRNDVVYVTICVEDSKNPDIKIEPEQIVFHSVAGLEQKVYDVTIPLYAAVEPENSKTTVGGRYIELVLKKPSTDTKYWPQLTKEKKKYHWLKVDFKKWKDESDSEDEAAAVGGGGLGGDGNIDDMLNMMGGGAGGPKFGGLGGGLGGDYNIPSDEDSDDEEMPELDDIESETTGKGKEKSEETLPSLEEVKPKTTA
ncbi:co-chaperone protein daf-41 [Acyrthosiphon pisum]|uniref:CS domain-containing protein n=1 Tax=Acyrthosiphon pisum TaxID=7029 RepID=A0A8R2A9S6_ACYPI|nr:co-chaperone protein daf-41 [Acyrthosiphon pisum]|eukprot:XP_001951884.1 PREDICTED: co-chaperone protein daf-41 [Acyrthosiphon pisum]